MTTTRGAAAFPLRTSVVDYGERTFAVSGLSHSSVVQLTEVFDIDWELLTTTEKESLEDFTRDVGTSTPWFIILDPDEVFSDDFERNIRYVKFESGPSFSLVSPGNWSSSWSLREEV